jgi:dTDP-4-amino-4,6-dideoxygalactose transaminase
MLEMVKARGGARRAEYMKVPLLDLTAQFQTVETDVRAAIDRVLSTNGYVLGPEVQALEEEIAAYCGATYGVGVSNGSDAIVAALMALDIGPGDEVIVPVFTFFATAGSVSRVGATPVFVDILPDTFNMDPAAVEAAITPRTKAIVPVHLYGQCVDMDRFVPLAEQHNLAVIEDAAQAIGATFNGRPAGSFGTAATISFYPTKNLSAIGEAGMVVTSDEKLAETLKVVRLQGQTSEYEHGRMGANFRLDGIQAAALRAKLPYLDGWNASRARHAAAYSEAFAGSSVTPPPVDERCGHVFHQYTIRSPQRDALRDHLVQAGVGCKVFYPMALHLQPCFADLGGKPGDCPVAEQAAKEVLSLPIFPEMTDEQRDYVIEQVLSVA